MAYLDTVYDILYHVYIYAYKYSTFTVINSHSSSRKYMTRSLGSRLLDVEISPLCCQAGMTILLAKQFCWHRPAISSGHSQFDLFRAVGHCVAFTYWSELRSVLLLVTTKLFFFLSGYSACRGSFVSSVSSKRSSALEGGRDAEGQAVQVLFFGRY